MKKKFRLLLFFALLVIGSLLLPIGCDLGLNDPIHKKPPLGRVIETGTGVPIPGARVYLADCDGEFLGSFNCTTLDSTNTDAGGSYAFDQSGFMVNAFKAGYFADHTTSALVLAGSEEHTDIVLPPFAWLEVTVRNESGASFSIFPPNGGGSGGPGINLVQGADTLLPTLLIRGNQEYKYLFSIYTDSGQPLQDLSIIHILYEDGSITEPTRQNSLSPWFPVYLPGHDTTHITIAF